MDIPDGWTLARSGKAIERTLRFASFADAFAFLTRVAQAAEAMDHHPDIRLRWNRVDFTLCSHDRAAVTDRDIALAQQISKLHEDWPTAR